MRGLVISRAACRAISARRRTTAHITTYNYDGNPCGLTKSYLYFLPNCNSRASIYALPKLGLTFHAHLSSRDCTTCLIKVEGDTIFFSSVYLDIRLTVEELHGYLPSVKLTPHASTSWQV
jgi:hypothetical protein